MRIIASALLTFTMVASVNAQSSGEASVSVQSEGGLVVSITDASFGNIPYSFDNQVGSTSIVVGVEDNRGTGEGWRVTLYGGNFERADGTSFAITNLALASGVEQNTAGQGVEGIAAPGGVVGESSPGTVIASAATLQGMGRYSVTYPATLTVPGGTLIGDYSSTLVVSITSGP